MHVFLRVNDPYSYLLLQVLPELTARFEVTFRYHTVSGLQDQMYPEPKLWHDNALSDARHIADLYQLTLPTLASTPSKEQTAAVTQQLLEIEDQADFLSLARSALNGYWRGEAKTTESAQLSSLTLRLNANNALLESLGHYLSASLFYSGEWYWGIDRLVHLERRFNERGLSRDPQRLTYNLNTEHFCRRLPDLTTYPKRPEQVLTIYFSARSPYSYLGLERSLALATHYKVPVNIKPVLPMMMRGMNVPPTKKWYIFFDTCREARNLGLDYGFVADPLGQGVERCYALFEYAKARGKAADYLLSFARAVNAQGIRSDTDQGMRTIVERVGLSWTEAAPVMQEQLRSQAWRSWAEANYQQMHELGLWGVPSFQYGDLAVWGQDRIDVLERAVCRAIVDVNA